LHVIFSKDNIEEAQASCNKNARVRKLPKHLANSSGAELEKIAKKRIKSKVNLSKLQKTSKVQNSAYLLELVQNRKQAISNASNISNATNSSDQMECDEGSDVLGSVSYLLYCNFYISFKKNCTLQLKKKTIKFGPNKISLCLHNFCSNYHFQFPGPSFDE
jgi:hypothetical protein